MSFLLPIFLWLLPLAAIPLFIHLLNRMNVITIDFSSIKFLNLLEKESIRNLKLLQLLLLLLRTLIILLIIFMITRPVLTGALSLTNAKGSSLHAIILDDSFSVQGNSDIIKKAVVDIIKQIPEKGQLIWVNANRGIMYNGLKEEIPPLENLLSYTYLAGDVEDGLDIFQQYIENDSRFVEVYILTDSQEESFKNLWKHSDQYKDMHVYVFVTPKLNDNLSITKVDIFNEILLPNHTIDLAVTVKNTGNNDQENILLQLIIDNMSVGQQIISLPTEIAQTFLFQTSLSKAGNHQAMIELDSDDKEADNRYFFNLYLPKQRKIAFISNSQEESFYIQASMKALNISGESLSISEYKTLDDPSIILEHHDAVFIFSPNMIQDVRDSKIEEYLYNGGHLVILSGINTKPTDYSIVNTLTQDIRGNYNDISLHEISGESFQDIDLSSIQSREIYKLFYSKTGGDRNIRFFKYINLPYDAQHSQLRLNDGSVIWNRYNINNGIIDILGFAINLKWSNFPIKGTFLPFIHFMTYSERSNKENINKNVGNHWKVLPQDYYPNTIFHILPDGSRKIINTDATNYLVTDILEQPGYHSIKTEEVIISKIAVNIDEVELNPNYTTIEKLQDRTPDNIQIIPMNSDILTEINQARIGIEMWRYILYLIIILVMIEMSISNVQKNN